MRDRKQGFWGGQTAVNCKNAGFNNPLVPVLVGVARKTKSRTLSDSALRLHVCLSIEDQDGCRDHRRPKTAFVADGSLGDVGRADDLVGETIDLFLFIP